MSRICVAHPWTRLILHNCLHALNGAADAYSSAVAFLIGTQNWPCWTGMSLPVDSEAALFTAGRSTPLALEQANTPSFKPPGPTLTPRSPSCLHKNCLSHQACKSINCPLGSLYTHRDQPLDHDQGVGVQPSTGLKMMQCTDRDFLPFIPVLERLALSRGSMKKSCCNLGAARAGQVCSRGILQHPAGLAARDGDGQPGCHGGRQQPDHSCHTGEQLRHQPA